MTPSTTGLFQTLPHQLLFRLLSIPRGGPEISDRIIAFSGDNGTRDSLRLMAGRRIDIRSSPLSFEQALWWTIFAGLLVLLNFLVFLLLMRLNPNV